MRGAESLIAVRQQRRAPALVVVHLTAGDWPDCSDAGFLQLDVDADFERQDWRPLVGLRAVVHGPTSRPQSVIDACRQIEAAGAKSVLGFRPTGRKSTRSVWFTRREISRGSNDPGYV